MLTNVLLYKYSAPSGCTFDVHLPVNHGHDLQGLSWTVIRIHKLLGRCTHWLGKLLVSTGSGSYVRDVFLESNSLRLSDIVIENVHKRAIPVS
jgi:hypothetical protein